MMIQKFNDENADAAADKSDGAESGSPSDAAGQPAETASS
jgi:hypothetical protein